MDAIVDPARLATWSFDVIAWLFAWGCQALLLLGAAWVAAKLDRSDDPAARYRIWLIAAVAVAVIPWLVLLARSARVPAPAAFIAWPAIDVSDLHSVGDQAGRAAASTPSLVWPLLLLGWAAGVAACLFRWGRSLYRVHLVRATARPTSGRELGCDLGPLAAEPLILLSSEVRS